MSDYKYFPLIKTRDAELRCFQHLSDSTLDQILPIYELTKSRKTTKAPDGDIHKRMGKIEEIQGGKPFILDLSTHEKYLNPQIEQLLNEEDGFDSWKCFINLYKHLNIIPMIHLYADDTLSFTEVESFVSEMSKTRPMLAVRLPYDLETEDISVYLEPIFRSLHQNCKVIIIFDADYIRKEASSDLDLVVSTFIDSISTANEYEEYIEDIVMLCTSFPSNVRVVGGDDAEGEFQIFEEAIYQGISESVNVKYGDYTSINTEQIEMKGGTFVPRIDIALANTFIYKRFRRGDGSYPRCALRMKADPRYIPKETWADSEIELASQERPTGISPSYWISVRMDYYIKTRLEMRT